ncbi:hypothetical protein ACSEPQ_04835 [Pseudomonas aeruginosa]
MDYLGYDFLVIFSIIILEVSMSAVHDSPAFAALVGTPREVRSQLDKSKARQVIVLPVEEKDSEHADLLVKTLSAVASFIAVGLREQDEQSFKALVNAVLPKAPPSPNLLREAAMTGRARKAVLEGADWLTAAQIAEVADLSASNPSTQPNKWKRQGQIFAVHHNGVDYFPGYALDPEANYRPHKSLKPILEVFGDEKDGWGLASWFLAANSFLGGRRPQDVLMTEPERVLAAARDEMEEVAHA